MFYNCGFSRTSLYYFYCTIEVRGYSSYFSWLRSDGWGYISKVGDIYLGSGSSGHNKIHNMALANTDDLNQIARQYGSRILRYVDSTRSVGNRSGQLRLVRLPWCASWSHAPYFILVFMLQVHLRFVYEPEHDKTNNMTCAPSENSDLLGHPPSLLRVFAVRMKKA